MHQKLPTVLFSGPSLTRKSRSLIDASGVELMPPVQRGDIEALLKNGFRGTIILVDGVFHNVVAVGHAELRIALSLGCPVWGLSSLGAIRAYEMRNLGMQGYGKVYQRFFSMPDFQDDELALIHSPGPEYFPISEPMVHFRECVEYLENSGLSLKATADKLIHFMKSKYYGDRTLALFSNVLKQHSDLDPDWVIENFDKHRVKSLDLEDFLEKKIWEKPLITKKF